MKFQSASFLAVSSLLRSFSQAALLDCWPEYEELTQKSHFNVYKKKSRTEIEKDLAYLKACSQALDCDLCAGEEFYFIPRRYFEIFEGRDIYRQHTCKYKVAAEFLVKLHFYTSRIAHAISYEAASRKQLRFSESSLKELLDSQTKSFKSSVPLAFQHWVWKHKEKIPGLDWDNIIQQEKLASHPPTVYRKAFEAPREEREEIYKTVHEWGEYKKGALYSKYLQFRNEHGYNPNSNQVQLFYEELAGQGCGYAQFLMGDLKDDQESLGYFLQAAARGFPEAIKKSDDFHKTRKDNFHQQCRVLSQQPENYYVAHYYLGLRAEENRDFGKALEAYYKAHIFISEGPYDFRYFLYPYAHKRIALIKLYDPPPEDKKNEDDILFHLRLGLKTKDPFIWGILAKVAYEGKIKSLFPETFQGFYERFLGKAEEEREKKRQDLQNDVKRIKEISDNQERFRELTEKAREGSPFHAYELAEMYESGRGIPFQTPEEWLKALKSAQTEYGFAAECNVQDAAERKQQVAKKVKSLQSARGYILNKIISTVSFDPTHPQFKDYLAFMDALYPYSPEMRTLGVYLLQQALLYEDGQENIMKNLLELIWSEDLRNQIAEEEPESEKAVKLLGWIVSHSKAEPQTPFSQFITKLEEDCKKESVEKGYILRKIKEAVEKNKADAEVRAGLRTCVSFAPDHPLYEASLRIIQKLQEYTSSVQEVGIYLFQQLLRFPAGSQQAKVILDYFESRVQSADFKADDEAAREDPDAENLAEAFLKEIGEKIVVTLEERKLVTPKELPQVLYVKETMISDPRIGLYNLLFAENNKPFERDVFDKAVNTLMGLFSADSAQITQEMLYDDESKEHGNANTLRNFLTNGEFSYGGKLTPRFAHRVITIERIFRTLDEGTRAAQLASWAIAGHHCAMRSESETYKFYANYTRWTDTLAETDNTLDIRIALLLAQWRERLLEQLVPTDLKERDHLLHFLKKAAKKELGLVGDFEQFEDFHSVYASKFEEHRKYRNIVCDAYKNPDPTTLRRIIVEGHKKELIKPGEGYRNVEKMVSFITQAINEESVDKRLGSIDSKILARVERDFKSEASQQLFTYYDEDRKISQEGAKALLYSLGYLEAG